MQIQKPGKVTAIAAMALANGILNILWGLSLSSALVLGTVGIGLLCAPITLLPLGLGIVEIIYAASLLSASPSPTQLSQTRTIAILEICCILYGNIVSLIVGILVLVFFGDLGVQGYLVGLKKN